MHEGSSEREEEQQRPGPEGGQGAFEVADEEGAEVATQVGQQSQGGVVVLDDFVGDVVQEFGAGVKEPGGVEEKDGGECEQPGQEATASNEQEPEELGEGQEGEGVEGVESGQQAEGVGDAKAEGGLWLRPTPARP